MLIIFTIIRTGPNLVTAGSGETGGRWSFVPTEDMQLRSS